MRVVLRGQLTNQLLLTLHLLRILQFHQSPLIVQYLRPQLLRATGQPTESTGSPLQVDLPPFRADPSPPFLDPGDQIHVLFVSGRLGGATLLDQLRLLSVDEAAQGLQRGRLLAMQSFELLLQSFDLMQLRSLRWLLRTRPPKTGRPAIEWICVSARRVDVTGQG